LVCTGEKNGKKAASSKIIVVQKSTAISMHDNDYLAPYSDIIVYPNPANEKITIDFGKLDFTNAELYVKDISGWTVFKKTEINNTNINVDISSISKGIYFVNIINDNANIFTKKIVKQ
jgi:hypothetical protein